MRTEGLMRGMKWKREIKRWKEQCATGRPEWAAEGAGGREKNERDLASHFVDRLNKSIKAHWSTLIELHKWDWGGTHGKAATKQQQGWADHGFRHFLKLIIHAGPSLLFFYPLICPSVFSALVALFNFSSHPSLIVSVALLNTAPFITETHFPSLSAHLFSLLSKLRTFSHFVPEQPWLKLKPHDFVRISWANQTWDVVFYISCNSLDSSLN